MKYIKPKQAAELLQVDISTLYKWLNSGALPAVKRNGTRWLIDENDALAMLQPGPAPIEFRGARQATASQREAAEILRRAGIG